MNPSDYPFVFFALSFFALWLSAQSGAYLRRGPMKLEDAEREDLGVILGATLTLLGLIIGFSFSMATSRYDQRKNCEEAEANAIGTEYVRGEMLPAADAVRVRELLRSYLDQRIMFYTNRNASRLKQIDASTTQLQNDLWFAVRAPTTAQPTPLAALVLSGMNDVLNSQGYTQAAWWNRIPSAAWFLMAMIGVGCNILFGYNARRPEATKGRFLVLPLIVAVSFFLIADLDSPRGGMIRVHPRNLTSLSDSLQEQLSNIPGRTGDKAANSSSSAVER
jgi:hypothetical protein